MMPGNPILGGTVLRRSAEQSPNFVHGVSGWFIGADGSAEFNNGTFRGTVAAATIVASLIESAASGRRTTIDSNGDIKVYNASGAVLFWFNNADNAQFYYADTGSATQGALTQSFSAAAGTDPFSNPYRAGINSYVTISGTRYAIGLNTPSSGIVVAPGLSVQDTAHLPFAPPGFYAEGSSSTTPQALALMTSGQSSSTDPSASVQALSQVQSGISGGEIFDQCGLSRTNAPVEIDGVPPVPAFQSGTAIMLFPSTTGIPNVKDTADSNVYTFGKKTADVTSTITINLVTDIVISSVTVAAGVKYRYKVMIVYRENQSAGQPVFGFDGTATASIIIGKSWIVNGGGATPADTLGQVFNGAFIPTTGVVMVNGAVRAYEAEGFVTFSAGGTFNVRGHTTVAADTWSVAIGSFLEIEPVG